jgi:hypothetical protein
MQFTDDRLRGGDATAAYKCNGSMNPRPMVRRRRARVCMGGGRGGGELGWAGLSTEDGGLRSGMH